jgi:hypothetical protein
METKAPAPTPAFYRAPPSGQVPSGAGPSPSVDQGFCPPALHPPSLLHLVRLPPSTEVVVPARAAARVAAPPKVVPPAGVASRHDRYFTTPRPRPSPCGWAKASSASHPLSPALLIVPLPPYSVPPMTPAPPQLPPSRTPTPTPWSPMVGRWDSTSLTAIFGIMAMTTPPSEWVVDSRASYTPPPLQAHTLSLPSIPFLPPLLDRRWRWFHFVDHLSRCLGSSCVGISQQRSRSPSYHS